MALRPTTMLHQGLPIAEALVRATSEPLLRPLPRLLPPIRIALPLTAISGISSTLQDVWETILRAVPKKKTSHAKKRHRQMAGKALKDVTALNRCSSCGRVKMMHILCPFCVKSVMNRFAKLGLRKQFEPQRLSKDHKYTDKKELGSA